MKGHRLQKMDWLVSSGLALLLVLFGSFQMVSGVCGVFHDDAVYVSTAQALSQGEGYRLINLPHSPLQTKYPILYPAILALIWKFYPSFPDNLLPMKWLTLLLGAATIGFAYLYLVRGNYFSRGMAAAAALLTITSPLFLYFCTLTLSEIPFAFTVILAAWALDRRLTEQSGSCWSDFSLGLLLALPFLTRSIGIVFAPIGLAILYFSGRSVRWVFLGAASFMLPWLIWILVGPRWNDLQVTSYYTNYVSWWSSVGNTALIRVVLMNFILVLYNSASIGLGIFNPQLFFPASAWLLVVVAGSILYLDVVKDLRQGRVLPCFLTGYLLLVLTWPWLPYRFLIPILPFLLAYLINWTWRQLQKLSFIALPKILGISGLCLLLAFNVALIHKAVATSQAMHYPYSGNIKDPLAWSSYQGIFVWITTNTRPQDIIASGLDTMVYLYTGRCAFRPFVGRPVSLFYGDHAPPLGPMQEIIQFIKIYQARYLVHTPMPGFSEEKPMAEFVEQVQKKYPGWLKLVYLGDDKRFVVFELQSDHEPNI
jgi:hypothetical protein